MKDLCRSLDSSRFSPVFPASHWNSQVFLLFFASCCDKVADQEEVVVPLVTLQSACFQSWVCGTHLFESRSRRWKSFISEGLTDLLTDWQTDWQAAYMMQNLQACRESCNEKILSTTANFCEHDSLFSMSELRTKKKWCGRWVSSWEISN